MKGRNFLWVKLLLATVLLSLLGSGWALAADEPGTHQAIDAEDVKLLVDFSQQKLLSQGRPIPFENLEISGSANFVDQGLETFKEGVNEIIDPSFEGSGWMLSDGASVVSSNADYGSRSLQVIGDGSTGVFAELKERIPVYDNFARQPTTRIAGSTRALSFSYLFTAYQGGGVSVEIEALDGAGVSLGSASTMLEPDGEKWLPGGIIYDLPEGTASYQVKIKQDGLNGTCLLDAFMSEHKDYFTPFFDGDVPESLWVDAATPQNVSAVLTSTTRAMLLKGIVMLVAGALFFAGSLYLFIAGYRRKLPRWLMAAPLVGIPLALLMAVGLGVTTLPQSWPIFWSVQGSHLDAGKTYFYRLTSIDAQGNESPPSVESRISTQWVDRKVMLAWDKDPGAVAYRVYRGSDTYDQIVYAEIGADATSFTDTGEKMTAGSPPAGPWENTGTPHASRSLRPAPDIRISNNIVGLDVGSDFWVAGDLQFGFYSDRTFRPSSLFEIGNADIWSTLAVSFRYVPAWGDEASQVLLIKGIAAEKADFEEVATPQFGPGSELHYVVAQLFEPSGDMQAGVHLWYRIADGEVQHLFVENTDKLSDNPYIVIAKRNYYDYFSINSLYRDFAIVQGSIDETTVESILKGNGLNDAINSMT